MKRSSAGTTRTRPDHGEPGSELHGCRPAQEGDPAPRKKPIDRRNNSPEHRWDGGLIDAYARAGEDAKLAQLIQDELVEARKTLPKDSPQLAALLAQIGRLLG